MEYLKRRFPGSGASEVIRRKVSELVDSLRAAGPPTDKLVKSLLKEIKDA